ncbi:MAG: sugar phosphate nucleotidyltransferase [Anaerolineaceae bacterium]
MNAHAYAVIMAGGGGTRLWPLSRRSHPKQMLKLDGKRSLFRVAVDRLADNFPPERILVVTVAEQAAALQKETPEIPAENFILEPMPRGTASVVGLAAVTLRQRDPQALMAVLTADHFIQNTALFSRLLAAALEAAQTGYLMTLGIEPTYPATGYGYIQRGEKVWEGNDLKAYRVARFKEKPAEAQAKEMLAGGDHAWNSGMFFWRVDQILGEFERQMPDLYAALLRIEKDWGTSRRQTTLQIEWQGLKSETIDYGIMEHARQVAVLPAAGLGWNDVGSWDSLFDVLEADDAGNIGMGGAEMNLSTRGTLVCTDRPEKLVVTIGVDDLVVVDTPDALLICRKDQAQRVREVVNRLKETGKENYL